MTTRAARIAPQEFCDIVRKAKTIDDIASKTGMAPTSVRSKIYTFRRQGIPLQTFKTARGIDWADLAAYERRAQKDLGISCDSPIKTRAKNGKSKKNGKAKRGRKPAAAKA